ncbi:MAG: hypothetical protein JXL80_02840 [Planctomycetes bacterium]|nr:hypothetical protein [Planctomycetota bacterium]
MGTFQMSRILTPNKFASLCLAPTFRCGDFDSHGVDCPFPFRHEDRWWMTYVGFDGTGYRTGLASSDDLLTWTREGLCLDRGPAGSPTQYNAALTNILRDNDLFGPGNLRPVDGRLLATYHAYPDPGYEAGPAAIGLCRSDDLQHWEVDEPVLRAADGAAWERGSLYKSYLMEHGGRYYLFYNAKDRAEWPWREQIGVAWSGDLATWTRHPGNPILPHGGPGEPDEIFAADPVVFRVDDAWVMFYYGLAADGRTRELAAVSDDLLTWRKTGRILVDVGPAGSIDSLYAHKPGLIACDGVLYHYYCACRKADASETGDTGRDEIRGIALATSRAVI